MSKKLWFGASVLVVTGFAGKQWLFQEVSSRSIELRAKEDREAAYALQKARESAKEYFLTPLTDSEKKRLQELMADDPEFQKNVEFDDNPALLKKRHNRQLDSGKCCNEGSK